MTHFTRNVDFVDALFGIAPDIFLTGKIFGGKHISQPGKNDPVLKGQQRARENTEADKNFR